MRKSDLTRRAHRYQIARTRRDDLNLYEAAAARDGWEAGYRAARKDLRREIDKSRASDGFLSYGQIGMTVKRWLCPIR